MLIPGLRNATRLVIARTMAGPMGEERYARERWGDAVYKHLLQRAAVSGIQSSDDPGIGAGDSELWEAVRQRFLPSALPGIRRVPFVTRMIRHSTRSRGHWVGQSRAIPVSRSSLSGSSLPRRKIGVLIVQTLEAMEDRNPDVEELIQRDIIDAVGGAFAEAFLDPANVGVADMMPASIFDGVDGLSSIGDPASDIAATISAFAGDLRSAAWVTDPLTAAQIALARDAGGSFQFPDAGPNGGAILGLPLLTTLASPRASAGGQLALIDGSGVALAESGVKFFRSTDATIECSDEPTGATDEPTALSSYPISLFQEHAIGVKAVVYANWERQRDCVAYVAGVDYPTGASS